MVKAAMAGTLTQGEISAQANGAVAAAQASASEAAKLNAAYTELSQLFDHVANGERLGPAIMSTCARLGFPLA